MPLQYFGNIAQKYYNYFTERKDCFPAKNINKTLFNDIKRIISNNKFQLSDN